MAGLADFSNVKNACHKILFFDTPTWRYRTGWLLTTRSGIAAAGNHPSVTSSSGLIYSQLPAKLDGEAYGEPTLSGIESGKTCQYVWPAAASQSIKS